jgi:hypothetical protein
MTASIDIDLDLAAALAAWRSCRSARLAALIEQISWRANAVRTWPRVYLTTHARRWSEIAAKRDPGDLDHLLTQVAAVDFWACHRRVEMLARWDPDPRIAAELAEIVAAPPTRYWTTQTTHEFWEAVVSAWRAHASPAAARRIAAIPWISDDSAPTLHVHKPLAVAQRSAFVAALLAISTDEPAIPPAIADRCADLEARYPASADLRTALHAAVLANPDDPGARGVYGDHLTTIADPLGELIALGPALGRGNARVAELYAQYGYRWSRPLCAVGHVALVDGVPTKLTLEREVLPLGEPTLATIRALHFMRPDVDQVALFERTKFPVLVDIAYVTWRGFAAMSRTLTRRAFTALRILVDDTSSVPPDDLESEAIATLETLEISSDYGATPISVDSAARVLASRWGRTVERCFLRATGTLADWLRLFAERDRLHALEIRDRRIATTLTRDATGAISAAIDLSNLADLQAARQFAAVSDRPIQCARVELQTTRYSEAVAREIAEPIARIARISPTIGSRPPGRRHRR